MAAGRGRRALPGGSAGHDHVPVAELLGGQVHAVTGVGDVVVLAEDAAQVAHAEEDGAAAVVALDAGLLAEVGGDDVDLGLLADEAHARGLVAVDAAETGAQVAVAQVGVGPGPLPGGIGGAEGHVAGGVVVEEERGCQVEGASEESLSLLGMQGRWQQGVRPAQEPAHCLHRVGIPSRACSLT